MLLQFLQSQTKVQETRHFKWASYLQQFHLVIKYKKGVNNKVADCLSHAPTLLLQNFSITHFGFQDLASKYPDDLDFK